TPDAAASLSWNIDNKFYDFDQWDIQYNRPDKILELTDEKELANAYYKAYLKRLKKNGLTEQNFNQTNQLPQAIIMNEITDGDEIANDVFNLKIKIIPIKNTAVNKIFVLVNGCPVMGKQGFKTLLIKDTVLQFPIKMSADLNNIKISCMDKFGNESVREQLQVIYHPKSSIQEKQHFIGIGINQFANSDYNLSWSVKDIRDLALTLKTKYPNIIIDTLFDKDVTKENILALKKKLLLLNEDDKVIVSYSGHGVLSKDFDYFLSTYSINFEKPEENGLSYDDLENLLDSIKPRQKLMLIDACHSGEVDKDEIAKVEASKKELEKNGVVTKSTIKVKPKKSVGMANSFELMQSLFVNVGKGTGATIISAAGGMQYAQERGDLKNGVFTYSILEAFNKNATLKVSELKKIVGERVIQLTNGLQKPTSRNETNNYDWLVW
ncbi:MAG: caspase family protein, partial [Chitinophagaceae bacterium]|nr:caspase family protein [Chitinophagaceae bacterium]